MSHAEGAFLVAAGILYVASYLLTRNGLPRYGFFGIVAALVFHLASAAIRWAGVGHPPIFGTYEATLAASWFLALFVALSFRSIHGHFRLLVLTAVPVALLLLLYGLAFFRTDAIPLTISERSLWVDVHALFSWLAFAPFCLAFCLSGYLLWSGANRAASARPSPLRAPPAPGPGPGPEKRERHLDVIDELSFRYITFGFLNHSIMFALGSYYSSILFGTWWRWDPAFSLSLIAWLLIGLYIHLRLFYNWNRQRAARLYLAIFAVICVSYWGLVYLPAGSTFHVFDLDVSAL